MLSGVGKSGSPAPKSTTSTPSERSFSASAETFIVEETLMVEIRSAIGLIAACMAFRSSSPLRNGFGFGQSCAQSRFDRSRHQAGHIASERKNFFHQT